MKFLSIVFAISLGWFSVDTFAQDVDDPQILHITTLANNNSDQTDSAVVPSIKAGLVVLSLTSSDLFDHFERDVEVLKERYDGSKLIVAVDRDGASEKSEFMMDFYRLSLEKKSKNVYRKTFDEAFKNIQRKYGEIHFKAAMYDLTERKKKRR